MSRVASMLPVVILRTSSITSFVGQRLAWLAKFQIFSCRLMFGMSAKFYVLIDTHADIKR
jgi:hypothetical protein